MIRFNTDGSADSSFGNNGIVTIRGWQFSYCHTIILQPDGKILAAGQVNPSDTYFYFGIYRLKTNGELDSSFGNNGLISDDFSQTPGYWPSRSTSMILQPDNKILVANLGQKLVIARYNTDGSRDLSFANNKGFFLPYAKQGFKKAIINLLSNGNIILATSVHEFDDTSSNDYINLFSYFSDGTPNSSFGTNGQQDFHVSGKVLDLDNTCLQANNNILVSSVSSIVYGSSSGLLTRFMPDGNIDVTFGNNGTAPVNLGDENYGGGSLLLQANDTIILGGVSYKNQIQSIFAAKILNNGTPDYLFGNNGIFFPGFTASYRSTVISSAFSGNNQLLLGWTIPDTDFYDEFALTELNITDAHALPLRLLSFTVTKQNSNALLQWTTTHEINSNYFEIERSGDDVHFTGINKVIAKGNEVNNTYAFEDNLFDFITKPPAVFYRLKMFDKNGSFTYSEIRKVNLSTGFYTSIHPNPVKDKINVEINASQNEVATMEIINLQGKTVLLSSINISTGISTQTINVSSIASGNYFVRIKTNEGISMQQFVKQ